MVTYEIYRNRAGQTITLEPPSPGGTSEVFIMSDAHPERDEANVIEAGSLIEVTVPFKHTKEDGKIRVELDFSDNNDEFTVVREIDVVTPLFTAIDFSAADREQIRGVSNDDLKDLERFIRHIIEAYTGQSFGYSRRKYKVDNIRRGVTFDVPLVQFTGVSSLYATGAMTTTNSIPYEVLDDGFGIAFDWDNYHVKTDTFFLTSQRHKGAYEIEGYFGYIEVPQDVREAARLLISLFNCDQSLWRDRYIENLRNADGSTVKYNEGAYWGTGSVSADQLLSKYVRSEFGAVVI